MMSPSGEQILVHRFLASFMCAKPTATTPGHRVHFVIDEETLEIAPSASGRRSTAESPASSPLSSNGLVALIERLRLTAPHDVTPASACSAFTQVSEATQGASAPPALRRPLPRQRSQSPHASKAAYDFSIQRWKSFVKNVLNQRDHDTSIRSSKGVMCARTQVDDALAHELPLQERRRMRRHTMGAFVSPAPSRTRAAHPSTIIKGCRPRNRDDITRVGRALGSSLPHASPPLLHPLI